jgi:glucokinase
MSQNYLLAGDIGGTNSRLALYLGPTQDGEDGGEQQFKEALWREDYSNFDYVQKYGSTAFKYMLNDFLDKAAAKVVKCCFLDDGKGCNNCTVAACFACAGPIMNNACEFTNIDHDANLKFVIRGDDIKESTDSYQTLIKVC